MTKILSRQDGAWQLRVTLSDVASFSLTDSSKSSMVPPRVRLMLTTVDGTIVMVTPEGSGANGG